MHECSCIRNTHSLIVQICLSTCYVCPEHHSGASVSAEEKTIDNSYRINNCRWWMSQRREWFQVISSCQENGYRGAWQSLGITFQNHLDVLGSRVRVSECHGEDFVKITRAFHMNSGFVSTVDQMVYFQKVIYFLTYKQKIIWMKRL